MIRRISFRTAANSGCADAVGVAEGNFVGEAGLSVHHLGPRHPVAPPDLAKSITLDKQSGQPVAIAGHRIRTHSMQRHQDMIGSCPKAADPVLRPAWSGIAY